MSGKNVLSRSRIKKALALIQNGKLPEAKSLLSRICNGEKRNIEAWFLLGSVCGQLGLYNEAIAACRRVIELKPDHIGAIINSGNTMMSLARYDEAAAYYHNALQLQPDDPDTCNTLGSALYLTGKTEQAAEYFRRAIGYRDNFAHAYYNLANTLHTMGRANEAIYNFRQAINHDPRFPKAHIDLGHLLRSHGEYQQAEKHFRQALAIKPNDSQARSGLAMLARQQGKLDEALDIYKKMLLIQPDDADALAGEADILERRGNLEEAWARVRTAISKGVENTALADVYSRICIQHNQCEDALALCNRLLARKSTPGSERQTLHYALGRLLDRLGAFDEAFKHYKQANELSPFRFDPAGHAAQIDELIATFNPASMAQLPRSRNHSQQPVFIVGMPRSGTSLVEQILSSHPQVFGAGELNEINLLARSVADVTGGDTGYPACIHSISQTSVDKLAQQHLDCLDTFSPDALRITDKLPHNFMHLGLISILFPEAHIIHCVRNPLDTCLSIYFQNFNWMHQYSNDLAHLGNYYNQYQRLMEHWTTTLDIPLLEVQYEHLVKDQKKTSQSIVKFCGLEWDECCLQFHKSERKIATASYDQVRRPIYTGSIARWKNYEQHIAPLIAALAEAPRQSERNEQTGVSTP